MFIMLAVLFSSHPIAWAQFIETNMLPEAVEQSEPSQQLSDKKHSAQNSNNKNEFVDHNFAYSSQDIRQGLSAKGIQESAKKSTQREVQRIHQENEEYVVTTVFESINCDRCVNMAIEFDFDSAQIHPDSYLYLDRLGEVIEQDYEDNNIVVNGHTDSIGEQGYNLRLSYKRAHAVKRYLLRNFEISRSQIEIFGYGENLPLVANNTPRNRQKNRRVEVKIAD